MGSGRIRSDGSARIEQVLRTQGRCCFFEQVRRDGAGYGARSKVYPNAPSFHPGGGERYRVNFDRTVRKSFEDCNIANKIKRRFYTRDWSRTSRNSQASAGLAVKSATRRHRTAT